MRISPIHRKLFLRIDLVWTIETVAVCEPEGSRSCYSGSNGQWAWGSAAVFGRLTDL